ncbi:transcriptional regulator [Schizosaccharomyces cryophilus OY26]|uniref:Transcriptional regulator n=1 Tax=Schizosaccharomyces cryophilus (strain OY26 / ATCC MYA-4695 / CBS 11777 / NBRC 106824 / NRRL Y48691) TaxID=653667 RepID=S9W2R0_SCHCR|nr:transcriptional regulator [Schizosaccharomyces cryophilus OY26]EPY52824.1 transcriptional regulator [Schizosaccharomyces cryophilus OY26]
MSLVNYESDEEKEAQDFEKEESLWVPSKTNNWEIPSSPEGNADSLLEKKIEQFLALKRNNVHFHARLVDNENFLNPQLLDTLQEYAGISEPTASMMPSASWTPHALPSEAYAKSLRAAQDDLIKKREQSQRNRTEIAFQKSSS